MKSPTIALLSLLGLAAALSTPPVQAAPPTVDAWVGFSIRYWAERHGLNEDCFMELAYRESSWNPYAVGGEGERGLFQFKRRTWESLQSTFGRMETFNFDAAFNPWENAKMAALMLGDFNGDFDSWWTALPHCHCSIRSGPSTLLD